MGQTKHIPVPASEFKAKCLEILDTVSRRRTSFTISKRGKPVARLVPIDESPAPVLFGRMKGTMKITGDIVSPDPEPWDSER
jgi:prevent-host-death family protein